MIGNLRTNRACIERQRPIANPRNNARKFLKCGVVKRLWVRAQHFCDTLPHARADSCCGHLHEQRARLEHAIGGLHRSSEARCRASTVTVVRRVSRVEYQNPRDLQQKIAAWRRAGIHRARP